MMNCTVADAKRDFQRGYLSRYIAAYLDSDDSWTVSLLSNSGSSGALVDARTKKPRHFKSFDSMIRTLREIGFNVQVVEGG